MLLRKFVFIIKMKMKLKTYCLACKKHTDNSGTKRVTMNNKVVRDKPRCGLCFSDKPRFLKQKHN